MPAGFLIGEEYSMCEEGKDSSCDPAASESPKDEEEAVGDNTEKRVGFIINPSKKKKKKKKRVIY